MKRAPTAADKAKWAAEREAKIEHAQELLREGLGRLQTSDGCRPAHRGRRQRGQDSGRSQARLMKPDQYAVQFIPTAGKRAWSAIFGANVEVLRVFLKSETATVRVACQGLRDGEWMTSRGHRWAALRPAKTWRQIEADRRVNEARPYMVPAR